MSSTQPKTYSPTSSQRVAFLGLGVMGLPMAGHLALAGHQVTVYNRSPAKAEAWAAEFKGTSAPTPAQAATGADIVFCCVGNDADLRAVTLGPDGAFAGMKKGAIFWTTPQRRPMSRANWLPRQRYWGCSLSMRRSQAVRQVRKTACLR